MGAASCPFLGTLPVLWGLLVGCAPGTRGVPLNLCRGLKSCKQQCDQEDEEVWKGVLTADDHC